MIRITKAGDPRLLRTYRKFTCKACGCEFIADDDDYTVETHYLPPLDEFDPLALCDRRSTETFSSICPDCGTYIKADVSEVKYVPHKEIVKIDEKEYKKRMDLLL